MGMWVRAQCIANDLKKNPEKIAALEKLGVTEMVLFMAGPDVNANFAALEDGAKALIA